MGRSRTAEEVYERLVESLVEEHRSRIEQAARNGLVEARKAKATSRDEFRDYAVDYAENYMFHSLDFEQVKAVDISDVACEFGDEAERDFAVGEAEMREDY